jgi:glycosyltransferase involved in cell wall biosynthesis
MESIQCSVVIAAYNEEKHLSEALNSILLQDNINFEIIFVDDRSTDSTLLIAENIAKKDARVKIFHNPKKGKCNAFNFGVKMSSGDYICLFAGDDIMPKSSLKARLDAIIPHGTKNAVVGLSKIITMSKNRRYNGVIIPKKKGISSMSGSSYFMNKLAVDLIFPVPECLPNEDTWMELICTYMKNIKIIQSDIICCHWRMHSGNSINMLETFEQYSQKFALRKMALPIFLEKFKSQINPSSLESIEAMIKCEDYRFKGSILGVISSNVSLIYKLRTLSKINRIFYQIRRFFFSFFSGR